MAAKISIIMGIYNCANTLAEALDSLLAQTCCDWQAVLCDDGSTDATCSIAQDYASRYPGKFLLLKNPRNLGLNATLNRCLAASHSEYVARMDADDISLPTRLERELAYLESHPEHAIVSCNMIYFDEHGDWGQSCVKPLPEPSDFLSGTPFCHAPCLVRREAYTAVEGYTVADRFLRVEDYHLWMKMYALGYRGANLADALYKMRDDQNAIHRRKFKYRINEFRVRCLAVKTLKLSPIGYVYALRPIILGLLPTGIYKKLHMAKLKKKN